MKVKVTFHTHTNHSADWCGVNSNKLRGMIMKKCIVILLSIIGMLSLISCGKRDTFEITITIPAGSTEKYVYSEEEISPTKDTIIIQVGRDVGDSEVILKPIEVKEEKTYLPAYVTPGLSSEMDVEKGAWFKVGLAMQNPTDEDMEVTVTIKNINVRIE